MSQLLSEAAEALPKSALAAAAVATAVLLLIYNLATIVQQATRKLDLRAKHVIVTGGSKGLGRALARVLVAEYGAHVTIVARGAAALDAAVKDISAAAEASGTRTGRIHAVTCDVTDEESSRKAMAEAARLFGAVYGYFACAGAAHPQHFVDMSVKELRQQMDLNYVGSVLPLHAVLPDMMRSGNGGLVVFVSSICGLLSFTGYTAYGASKYAIRGFAEGLRNEMLPYRIRVHIAYPGNMDTEGFAVEEQGSQRTARRSRAPAR